MILETEMFLNTNLLKAISIFISLQFNAYFSIKTNWLLLFPQLYHSASHLCLCKHIYILLQNSISCISTRESCIQANQWRNGRNQWEDPFSQRAQVQASGSAWVCALCLPRCVYVVNNPKDKTEAPADSKNQWIFLLQLL